MALKDYYELSAMLRLQLPILLSFAILRCLMGTGTKFWLRKLVPTAVQQRTEPVQAATNHLLSLMHSGLLIAGAFYALVNYGTYKTKPGATSFVCKEFPVPRTQAFACANGILALCTSSDPLALGLALSTMMSVASGSVYSIVLAAITHRACQGTHSSAPWYFAAMVFMLNTPFYLYCATDGTSTDVTSGAVLCMSFTALQLLVRLSLTGVKKAWSVWLRLRRAVVSRVVGVARSVWARLRKPAVHGPVREHED
jgi:uncharacterized membrane-anchored protein